jgi:hypothetical protein
VFIGYFFEPLKNIVSPCKKRWTEIWTGEKRVLKYFISNTVSINSPEQAMVGGLSLSQKLDLLSQKFS